MSLDSAIGSPFSSVLPGDDGGRVVHDPVQTIRELAEIPPAERFDKMTALVEDKGGYYRWDEQSAAADADGLPPTIFGVIDDSNTAGDPPPAPANGDIHVVNNWGADPPDVYVGAYTGAYADGDVARYSAALLGWERILENVGGFVPAGTVLLVTDAVAAGSFAGKEGNLAFADGAGTYTFTPFQDTDGVVTPNDAPATGRWLAVPNTTALPPVTRDTRDPVATDDDAAGYQTGGFWFNTVTKRLHACTDNSTGAAVWACVSDPTNPIVSNAVDTTPSGVGVNMVGMTYTIPADSAGVYDFMFRAPIGGISVTGSMAVNARLAVNGVQIGNTVAQLVDGTGGIECRWISLSERTAALAAGDIVTVQWWLGTVNAGNSLINTLRSLRVKKVRN